MKNTTKYWLICLLIVVIIGIMYIALWFNMNREPKVVPYYCDDLPVVATMLHM